MSRGLRARPALAVALLVLSAASALAQGTTWGAEADVNSRYVWRGISYSDGPVLQPYVWITHAGATVSAWSNMEMNSGPRPRQFDQAFFTVSRAQVAGRWRVEPIFQGYVWRGLPGEPGAKTLELSAKLSRAVGAVSVVTTHTVDIAAYRGAYVADAGVEWARTVGLWRVESSATLAWANRSFNRTYVGADVAAVDYAQLSVAATRTAANRWYVRPHVELVSTVNADLRLALDGRTRASAGIAVGREF